MAWLIEQSLLLWDNEFEGLSATTNSVSRNSLIEGCQSAPLVNRQSQEVYVSDLDMRDNRIGLKDLKDADVLRPEVMARGFAKLAKDGTHSCHIAGSVR